MRLPCGSDCWTAPSWIRKVRHASPILGVRPLDSFAVRESRYFMQYIMPDRMHACGAALRREAMEEVVPAHGSSRSSGRAAQAVSCRGRRSSVGQREARAVMHPGAPVSRNSRAAIRRQNRHVQFQSPGCIVHAKALPWERGHPRRSERAGAIGPRVSGRDRRGAAPVGQDGAGPNDRCRRAVIFPGGSGCGNGGRGRSWRHPR